MVIVTANVLLVLKLIGVPVVSRLNIVMPAAVVLELTRANSLIELDDVWVSEDAQDTAPVNVQAESVAVVDAVVPNALMEK